MKPYDRQTTILVNIFFFSFAQGMSIVLIPFLAAELVENKALIGLIFAIPGALSVLFEVAVAGWSDAVARKPFVLLGAMFGLIAAILAAVRSDVFGLIGFSVLTALAATCFFPPVLAHLSEVSLPALHAQVQGINGFAQGIAAFGGVLAAGALLEVSGFRTAFIVVGVIYLVSVGLGQAMQEAPNGVGGGYSLERLFQTYRTALRLIVYRPQIQMATLVEMIYITIVGVVGNSFFPLYLTAQRGMSASLAGGFVSARNLASTLTSLLFGRVSRRFGHILPMILLLGIAAGATLLLPWSASTAMIAGLSIALGMGVGFIPAAPNIYIAEGTEQHERAIGYASVTLVSRFLQMLLAPLFGLLAQLFGLEAVFVAGAVAAGVVLIGIAWRAPWSAARASLDNPAT
jgi:YNFM family putative membrane transporter